MTDLDAILRAVLADPADDTPRLVYADELDNTGQHEYADFIRVQCELARMPRLVPANILCHQVEWEHFAGRLTESAGAIRFDPPAPGSSSGVGVLHYERLNPDRKPLAARQRELWPLVREAVAPLSFHRLLFGDDATLGGIACDENANAGYVVRRGFVDEVRLTAAALCGGPCERCGGEEIETPGCSLCNGTGDRPGLAATLAELPLTRVVLVGVEPHGMDRTGVSIWNDDAPRNPMSAVQQSARIPGPLYAELEKFAGGYTVGRCCYYHTRADALDALNLACLAYV